MLSSGESINTIIIARGENHVNSGPLTADTVQSSHPVFPFQVIHSQEPAVPTEQVITLEETQLAGSQVFVTLPDSQTSQTSSELVAVTVEDLLDGTVTLICGEAK